MGLQETDSCVAASSQFVPSTSEHHLVSSLAQQFFLWGEGWANPGLFP